MKKILLQKGRDEVGASLSATPRPPSEPVPPFSDRTTSSSGEHQKVTASSVECLRIATPRDRVTTPSDERHQPPSRSEFLTAPSLISAASMPVSSLPVSSLPLLMMPLSSRSGPNLDKYYLGESNRATFSLQPHAYTGFFHPIGEGRFLQYSRPADEEHVDYQVMRQESPYSQLQSNLNIPLRSMHDETVARMRKSAELQRFDERHDYGNTGFAGMVSMETVRREVAMDLVSSSNIVEVKNCDSMEVVEVDSEDEDRRMRSRSIAQHLDDDREDELPRMMDRARQMSPSGSTDAQDDSKNASPRNDMREPFKSPASTNQKTVYRPKGRPAKMAGGIDGGPGGRSIIRCPVCSKQFNNSSALAKHKLTHSDERKYACTLCNKAFKRQDHLNGHMMTHSSMKPFACKFIGCNKSYCDARSLRRHMENHHQESSSAASAAGSSGGYFSFDGGSFPQGYGADGSTGPGDGSLSYLQQVSPISPAGLRGSPQSSSRQFGGIPQGQMWVTGYNPLDEPKPVKCHVCGRGFKNIPALNGHMRLHGGYVRKDQDVDESQDVSRSSDAHTESRFSQSENSQSSASVSDRQHDSLPGPSTSFAPSLQPSASETGRRHFFLSSMSSDPDMRRGEPEKMLVVDHDRVRGHTDEVRSRDGVRGHTDEVRSRDGVRSQAEEVRSRDGVIGHTDEVRSRNGFRGQADEVRSRDGVRGHDDEVRSRDGVRGHTDEVRSRDGVRGHDDEVRSREGVRGHTNDVSSRMLCDRFGFPDRRGTRTTGGSREVAEFRGVDIAQLDVGRELESRCSRFGDSEQRANDKCLSPRKVKHEEEFQKNFRVKSRQLEKERPAILEIITLASHLAPGNVEKLPEHGSTLECEKVKSEMIRPGSISAGFSGAHQLLKSEKLQRKARGEEEVLPMPLMGSANPTKLNATVEAVLVKAGGAEFHNFVAASRHMKASASQRMDCVETSQKKNEGTREEKLSASGDECFPDSTSGREDPNRRSFDEKNREAKIEEGSCTDDNPQTGVTYLETNIPMNEGSMRSLAADLAPEGSVSANSPPRQVISPSARQNACLYRQRWMNLQLKQSTQCCPEIHGASPDCPTQGATIYGTGTDCGNPKANHKTHVPKETAHPNRHGRNTAAEVANCVSGNDTTSFIPARSSPTPHVEQASPLALKRGGLSTFSYSAVGDIGAAVVHVCHNGLAPCEGLHHVHSNNCITQTDLGPYVQPHIPCSPYDPRPHTPCAAHTPFTPCQPYTPHTPYTPCAMNRPSTPKHASHFEFPPRVCLQESSLCDSPYPIYNQAQLPGQQVEVRLVVEPEERPYRPLEKLGTETELLRQHCHGDRREAVSATEVEIERPRKHLPMDPDSCLNRLWQRDFDRQKQHHQLSTGTGYPGHQNEARNPEDGFAASLPTGAKRNSPGLAHESASEKPEKPERKRKPVEELDASSVETKRSVPNRSVDSTESTGRDSCGAEQVSSSSGIRLKTEDSQREESDQPKSFRGCAEHDGVTIFRNPPSPLKVKKSRPRPEPLFIPANVNHFGFQSRLRSPRLWDGLTKQTPPPYTPPPMLSPARSGSGLFWKLHSEFHSPLAVPPVLPKYDKAKCRDSWPEVPSVTELNRQPPETDTQPHINIGPQYQPDLPQFRGSKRHGRDYTNCDDHSTLVWNPKTAAKLKEEEVTQYMQYACCAIIPGNGANQEYAMHLLHLCKGDMKKAVKLLLEPEPKLPRSSGLKTYKYQDCVKWKRIEIELFHKAIMKLDKDFFQISKMVGTKTVKDCVQFYYLWKKICPDELKQLKILRRKREQFELYSRRSKDLHGQPLKQPSVQQSQKPHEETTVSRGSKKHEPMDSRGFQYQDSNEKPIVLKEEQMGDSEAEKQWCSVCKRSFTSARNFGIHMKTHKKSRTRREQAELDVA